MRKHKDLYLWLAKSPSGPSVKFLVSGGEKLCPFVLSFQCALLREVSGCATACAVFSRRVLREVRGLTVCCAAVVCITHCVVGMSCSWCREVTGCSAMCELPFCNISAQLALINGFGMNRFSRSCASQCWIEVGAAAFIALESSV